jgi:hypothetical protein
MGNNITYDGEDFDQPEVYYSPRQVEQINVHEDSDDITLAAYKEGFETLGTEGIDQGELEVNDQPHRSAATPNKKNKKSKRIKKVEDYFQWDTLKQKQQDMYFEFVKTAKKEWAYREYDDEEVEKVVLNKISLLRF